MSEIFHPGVRSCKDESFLFFLIDSSLTIYLVTLHYISIAHLSIDIYIYLQLDIFLVNDSIETVSFFCYPNRQVVFYSLNFKVNRRTFQSKVILSFDK